MTQMMRSTVILATMSGLPLTACATLPSCAWGKCAYPRSPALIPQMSERVYPLPYPETYAIVKDHLERRGYEFTTIEDNLLETEPYAERDLAQFLRIKYRWRVQVRKMDTLNTAVLPKLFLHEGEKPPRELSPGLWPEPYRYFYHEIETSLHRLLARPN